MSDSSPLERYCAALLEKASELRATGDRLERRAVRVARRCDECRSRGPDECRGCASASKLMGGTDPAAAVHLDLFRDRYGLGFREEGS